MFFFRYVIINKTAKLIRAKLAQIGQKKLYANTLFFFLNSVVVFKTNAKYEKPPP